MVNKSPLNEVVPVKSKHGFIIREPMQPQVHGNVTRSLTQVVLAVADNTVSYYQKATEEFYFVQHGYGATTLDDIEYEVSPGDTVLIELGIIHCIENRTKQNC